ncbi:hypothetical protein E8L90_21665 [Brevibacillus antibioticus]|uniref:ParB/Sulfiredoxin domain-containing protein n=1 Tax=Brevibacillus antibioticus TaxID=2570228 RepID=A0A4U2YAN2_9BACL|nr:hypothetical protein [Brevibacillus antibioticus]TKI57827.1 hypothetical protein E8L90_21665 [Brevibacillus antibioticus]
MKYTPIEIPLDKLILDHLNPRFVNIPNPDEEGIKEYLIEYEEVLTIAKGINEDEGLIPGERIIVCKENEKYIVLEGNRRICACKLLIGLLMTDGKLPKVKKNTADNIANIYVDLVDSRDRFNLPYTGDILKVLDSGPLKQSYIFLQDAFKKVRI